MFILLHIHFPTTAWAHFAGLWLSKSTKSWLLNGYLSARHTTFECQQTTGEGEGIQSWEKVFIRGLVKLLPAVAYHFCLNLPETFSQPRTKTFSQLCKGVTYPKIFVDVVLVWSLHVRSLTRRAGEPIAGSVVPSRILLPALAYPLSSSFFSAIYESKATSNSQDSYPWWIDTSCSMKLFFMEY